MSYNLSDMRSNISFVFFTTSVAVVLLYISEGIRGILRRSGYIILSRVPVSSVNLLTKTQTSVSRPTNKLVKIFVPGTLFESLW